MKYRILTAVLLAISTVSFSQDFMDTIAMKSCECLNTITDSLSPEKSKVELGLCIINAAAPYKRQLKEEYNIDFDKINTQGAKLGQLIGMKMMSVCPDILLEIANRDDGKDEDKVSELTIEGKITGIKANQFVVFSLKDEQGKISKFYWFTFINSDMKLSNDYKKLKNESVRITFITKKFFNAKIGEYRFFNIITKLEKLGK